MIGLVLAACAAFGAADQYVGSLTRFWPHAWEVSALSAPWLVLPFLVGRTQRDAARATVFGATGTMLALIAYGLMTLSPVEHAHLSVAGFAAFARSNALWFVGGAISGPLFGYLGYRWRTARALGAGLVTAGAVMVEPVVHAARHPGLPLSQIPLGPVTATELAVGVAMATWFGWQRSRRQRT